MVNCLFRNVLLFCLIFFFSCKTTKQTTAVATENCETLATVKDFTGLDGCSLMIVLDNGDKFLPVKIKDETFTLREGQRIKLSYKELQDVASICMAEKASIEITCIELIAGKPVVAECHDTNQPFEVPWMQEVIRTFNPASIKKFKFRPDGWAYLFSTGQKQILYDCQGTLLCEHQGAGVNKCMEKYLPEKKGKEIYSNQ